MRPGAVQLPFTNRNDREPLSRRFLTPFATLLALRLNKKNGYSSAFDRHKMFKRSECERLGTERVCRFVFDMMAIMQENNGRNLFRIELKLDRLFMLLFI